MRFWLLFIPILPLWATWHQAQGLFTQPQAAAYCQELKTEGKEWRLPQIYELFRLKGDPAYPKDTSYWSANSVSGIQKSSAGGEVQTAADKDQMPAYAFYLQDGDISITPKSKKIHILCTDTQLKPQSERSFSKIDSGILDEDFDIVWQEKDKQTRELKLDYTEAAAYCEALDLHGLSWRLPTLEELFSLVEYRFIRPTLNKTFFTHTMQRYYWSATQHSKKQAYVVGFKLGSVATSSQSNRSYLRCVSEDIP